LKILFIGDIVGRPGRNILERQLPALLEEHRIDFTIANGENAAGGNGINRRIFEDIRNIGVDAVTMGNHVWDKKEILEIINNDHLIRPVNYPPGTPGKGWRLFKIDSQTSIAVVNVSGRVFLPPLDCPFRAMEEILREVRQLTPLVVVDFHAEATSEKIAMGWFLDGQVTAVVGTHTHVQTADARLLTRGTAYITDAGMTGPRDSVLGVEREMVINKFLRQIPVRFELAEGDIQLNGVIIEANAAGRATAITPLQTVLESF